MDDIEIECEMCGSRMELAYDFDKEFVLKMLWCRSCNHTSKPIYREHKIKPDFVRLPPKKYRVTQ